MQPSEAERGAVAAELAVAMPAVVLIIAFAVGALGAASQQARLQDGASDAARLVGRGDDPARVQAVLADTRAALTETRSDGVVCTTLSSTWRIGRVEIPVSATGCAVDDRAAG